MSLEEFDIFDANMHPAPPYRASRHEAHRLGLWHQTFHCWILRRDAQGVPHVFLQQRTADGPFPNSFDISAAGHLQAGETVIDGMREIEEELGLGFDPAAMIPLGIYKQATDDHAIPYINREFCHTFFYETTHAIHDCRPQEEEVDGVFEISLRDGLNLFTRAVSSVQITGIQKQAGKDGYHPASFDLTLKHMWGYRDRCEIGNYYHRIFRLAEAYFNGERNLLI